MFPLAHAPTQLIPHYALQGSCRVPSYHVLHSDTDLPLHTIERLTYELCYGHYKCSRSVSVPIPIYYADALAERAAVYDENDVLTPLAPQQGERLFF